MSPYGYGDDSPSPPPFRAIRPGAPVDPLDRPRDRGAPRRVRWPLPPEAAPTPPRAAGRVARPGPPTVPADLARRALAPTTAPTVHAPTAVDHNARTLQLGLPDALAELAVKAVHAAEVCCAAARAALEDSDPDAARGYLDKAATMLETARTALR